MDNITEKIISVSKAWFGDSAAACELAICRVQNYKPERKNKKKSNSVPSLVAEETICNIDTVVTQERLTVSNSWKDTYMINLMTVCGLFSSFPGADPVKYTEGQMLVLAFLPGGQLERRPAGEM